LRAKQDHWAQGEARGDAGRSSSSIEVDPFRCRVWHLHDRLEEHITEETCREEIKSFLDHGQLVPALGRPLRNDPNHDIEIIYGARRLFVARHINKPLLLELRQLSDRDAFIAMDLENRQRKDISPYERGLSYNRWLRLGYFKSQDDIAETLGVSASQISRLLKLAKLPTVVVEAFPDAAEICETWGQHLADVLEGPETRCAAIQTARLIAETSPRLPAREVYRRLLCSATQGRRLRRTAHDRVIRSLDGVPLFRVRQQVDSVSLILPFERMSESVLDRIQRAVTSILEAERRCAMSSLEVGETVSARHELAERIEAPASVRGLRMTASSS
jgi:ParB family transcriptional regulator, chromosome partitioning protein